MAFSLLMALIDLACLFKGLSLHSLLYRGSESSAVSLAHCLVFVELFFRYLSMRNALSCSRITVRFMTESTFRLQHLQTRRDDWGKSGDSPKRTFKFSLRPAVVAVLKKLPCPDNLKLTPQIRQQLPLVDFCTFLTGVFGDLVDIFLCLLHGPTRTTTQRVYRGVRHCVPPEFFAPILSARFNFVTCYEYHAMARSLSRGACSI